MVKAAWRSDLPAIISANGMVTHYIADIFTSQCRFHMTAYPYDTQRCNFSITLYGYDTSKVNMLCSPDNSINLDNYNENGEWSLDELKCISKTLKNDGWSMPVVDFTFKITRKESFYLINTILPMFLLMILSLALFWVPSDSGEKLGLGITILLSYTVFQLKVANETPRTSDTTPILSEYLSAT